MELLFQKCDIKTLLKCANIDIYPEIINIEPISENEILNVVKNRNINTFPQFNFILLPINIEDKFNNNNFEMAENLNTQISKNYKNYKNPFEIAKWFIEMCNKVILKQKGKQKNILKLIDLIGNFERKDEEIQEEMCNLIGWDQIEIVEQILTKREQTYVSISELINYFSNVKKNGQEFVNTVEISVVLIIYNYNFVEN